MVELVASSVVSGTHGTPRVDGVTLSLTPGVTVLVGPNGSGKSSLMRLLAGFDAPDGGTVTLGGMPMARIDPRERARSIGWLPQNPGADWPMRVADCVAFGRFAHGDAASAAGKAIIETALADFDLPALTNRPLIRLSGGELVRTHLARVWAAQTPMLLLDEPLAALDPAHQIAVIDQLRRHSADGGCSLVILHDLALALRCADRLVGMRQGRICWDGAPETIGADDLASLYDVPVTLERAGGRIVPMFG